MFRHIAVIFIFLMAQLSGIFMPALAAQNDVMPTEIPFDPAVQAQIKAKLGAIPVKDRTLVEARQLVLLAISAADEGERRAASITEAEGLLAEALARFTGDPELMAFAGTLDCMKAGAPGLGGMLAMTYARQGFRKLDATVANNPVVLGARLQRAITFMRSPAFLGKGRVAQMDFEYLLQRVPSDKAYNRLRAMLLFYLGESQSNNGAAKDAAGSWVLAIELSEPGWSQRAASKLRGSRP